VQRRDCAVMTGDGASLAGRSNLDMHIRRILTPITDEVTRWFFEDYLHTWVSVGAGTSPLGPEFILDYWSVPMHYSADQTNQWLLDAPAVVRLSEQTQVRLRGQGLASTAVPDHRVTVYNGGGAAIEAILSRRRTDGSEIERLAAHFELALGPAGWRMVGIQTAQTSANSLNTAWPQ
jgi:hypothetical protein